MGGKKLCTLLLWGIRKHQLKKEAKFIFRFLFHFPGKKAKAKYWTLFLQFSNNEIGHHAIQVNRCVAAVNAVVSVGVVERFELFVRGHQGIHYFY